MAEPDTDLVSNAFEHALAYGNYRELTEEELARAIELDPSQISGLGPSIDALRAMLMERKQKILETFQVDGLDKKANDRFEKIARKTRPPAKLKGLFDRAIRQSQIYLLEQIWYQSDRSDPDFAQDVLKTMEALSDRYQIDELIGKYVFTGRQKVDIPQAIELKKELEQIDELLKQLDEASKTAQIGLIDMEALSKYTQPGDLNALEEIREQIRNVVREMAERQGLDRNESGSFRLTPKAYKTLGVSSSPRRRLMSLAIRSPTWTSSKPSPMRCYEGLTSDPFDCAATTSKCSRPAIVPSAPRWSSWT